MFAADKAIHDFHYLVTKKKYRNLLYVIKTSDHRKTGLYQGPEESFEGDSNSDLIRLIQKSQEIHY